MSRIKKILIANRGEIAVRVMRTCREMGIKTVAVFSDVDRTSLAVQMADEAYAIGPAPASESYLRIDKIIDVAKKSGADAIHPGYGFLSENAAFSEACSNAGIVFLGPRPDSIRAMGDKVTARLTARAAGIPIVPGTVKPLSDIQLIKKTAEKFGYPALLKAAAGGGGKGMRVVESESALDSAFRQAADEAEKSFGDGRLYLEKYIRNPRHVEVQIVCDRWGNCVVLLERECSLQRRHQKVIEEAPCPYLRDEVRRDMFAAALKLAKKIGYEGAGTVEFLVDENQNFYFLEMNTRLQVEHSVTEKVTGIDIVSLQIEIGRGERLHLNQSEITPRGHAIECRIYAEDPENNFMPSPGKIRWMRVPEGQGIRHDCGVYAGAQIPIYYDPMIAKLIVHAANRPAAIAKMRCALADYKIGGLKNNIVFLKTLLESRVFEQAKMHTQYIDRHLELLKPRVPALPKEIILSVAGLCLMDEARRGPVNGGDREVSNWWVTGVTAQLGERM